MLDRLRLLPTVMLCALLLLGLKIADIVSGTSDLSPVSVAQANEGGEGGEGGGEHGAEGGDAAAAKGHGAPGAALPDEGGTVSTVAPKEAAAVEKPVMSQAEIAVLQSLSGRRDELDKRAKELDTREQLIAAAEHRIEDRITELKALEQKVKSQLIAVDNQNDQQMQGVVKMYETMKPKDAARIFERLDMGVLLDVAKRMDPRKMSAVLASMDPVTAQELTVELATGGKVADGAAAKKQTGQTPAAMPAAAPAASSAQQAQTPPA